VLQSSSSSSSFAWTATNNDKDTWCCGEVVVLLAMSALGRISRTCSEGEEGESYLFYLVLSAPRDKIILFFESGVCREYVFLQ